MYFMCTGFFHGGREHHSIIIFLRCGNHKNDVPQTCHEKSVVTPQCSHGVMVQWLNMCYLTHCAAYLGSSPATASFFQPH